MSKKNGLVGRKIFTLILALGMATNAYGDTGYGVMEGDRTLLFEHEAYIASLEGQHLESMGAVDFGDTIDPRTGELSFRHTDISIPGNFDLPVEFTRYINSDPHRPNFLVTILVVVQEA